MVGIEKVFCDTYAIIEIFGGNPKFKDIQNSELSISFLNLLETYYYALTRIDQNTAVQWFSLLRKNVVFVDDTTAQEAMKFRALHRKRNLSYADAIGYVYALRNRLLFVTGDKEFFDLPNVLFVKK